MSKPHIQLKQEIQLSSASNYSHDQDNQINSKSQTFSNNKQINSHQNNQIKSSKCDLLGLCSIFSFFGIIFIAICIFVVYIQNTQPINQSITQPIIDDGVTYQTFNLVKLNSTSALCLDGSPGSYYISQGGDPSKVLIYFQAGGWCGTQNINSTLQDCYRRSKSLLGSSIFFSQRMTMENNILSRHANNQFKTWKKVIFNYCDGSGFQGSTNSPFKLRDQLIYFRGHNITVEILDDLNKKLKLFSKPSKVVVSGWSAGGLAVFTWANYIQQKVKGGKVYAIPDSGIFFDSQNKNTKKHSYKQTFKNLMKFSNIEIDPPVPQCIKQFPNQKQNCMFVQNIYKHLKVPLFAIQSFYDTWSVVNILGVYCYENCDGVDSKILKEQRDRKINIMQDIVRDNKNGVWGIKNPRHGITSYSEYINEKITVPQNSEYTVSRSISRWLNNPKGNNSHIDNDNK